MDDLDMGVTFFPRLDRWDAQGPRVPRIFQSALVCDRTCWVRIL